MPYFSPRSYPKIPLICKAAKLHFSKDIKFSSYNQQFRSSSATDSAEFTTVMTSLLASNRSIYEEVKQMQREHQKTVTTLTQFCKRHITVNGATYFDSLCDGRDNNSVLPSPGIKMAAMFRFEESSSDTEVEGDVEKSSESEAKCCNRANLEVKMGIRKRKEVRLLNRGGLVSGKEEVMEHKQQKKLTGIERSEERGDGVDEDVSSQDEICCFPCKDPDGGLHNNHMPHCSPVESSTFIKSGESSCSEDERTITHSDHYFSPSGIEVKRMWEKFSESNCDYVTNSDVPLINPRQKKWTTKVTVPQPFNMTIRDKANSTMKKKMSQNVLEKKTVEEVVRKKTFHATPAPANTFLPLYELINAKAEQRKAYMKMECAEVLELTQRPFSFHKRDFLKCEEKKEMLKQNEEQEATLLKKKLFKAKPVPLNLFNHETDEKMYEQEEYRKMLKKMRADDLLAKSKLPFRMQEATEKSDDASRKKHHRHDNNVIRTEEHCFHLKGSCHISDYSEQYKKFQQQLESRKCCKLNTKVDPFQLQTDEVYSRRKNTEINIKAVERTTRLHLHGFSGPPRNPPFPVPTRRTTQLRQCKMHNKTARSCRMR